MATEAQIRYAKGLIKKAELSEPLYPMDKDTPVKAASWLIDKLKNGEEISPNEYETIIRNNSDYDGAPVANEHAENSGGYGRNVFDLVLAKIKSPTVLAFTKAMINELPDYFFHVAASSSGKYHPALSAGEGGLVRHTLCAERIADDMLENLAFLVDLPQGGADMVRSGIVFHDGWKHGRGATEVNYTTHTHPLIPRQVYNEKIRGTLGFNADQEAVVDMILDAVESHMGPWTTNRTDPTVLPKPETPLQKMIHLCDYISSRKYISMDL